MKQHTIQAGPYTLHLNQKTYVMGILNTTPDSFSDGGKFDQVDRAIDRVAEMIEQGADMIDVGGESTRPGAEKIGLEEELDRVLPVIEALSSRFAVPISVDTYKAAVAKQALEAGANIINDVWGAKKDPKMVEVAAITGAPIILMHNRKERDYRDLIGEMKQDLLESIAIAKQAGVAADNIILDPGIGFAKTWEDNLVVMRNLNQFSELGFPLLLGTSRKSMIGKILDLPTDQRVEGTIATVCLGVQLGCQIVRVHDVKEIKRATIMMDAMLGKEGRLDG